MFASHRREIELRHKAELDEAERYMRDANPDELVEAKRHFRQALHAFTRLVMHGISPAQ
jgi:hypothetical protein